MSGFDLSGPAALVAIGLPLAMMATLIAILTVQQRRRARLADSERPVTGRYGIAVGSPVPKATVPRTGSAPVARPGPQANAAPAPATATPPSALTPRTEKVPSAPSAPPVPERKPAAGSAPIAAPSAAVAEIAAKVARAEQLKDESRLPGLYLALGEAKLAAGSTAEGAEFLRKSIRSAIRSGDVEAHAKARLELGDLARASGDLTTACEHWQIARGLYFEARRSTELEAVESRMQRHGCPTDWVLNDF